MQAVAPQAQANIVNIPVPTAQPMGGPVAPPQAPVVPAGGAPEPTPPPPPGFAQGSMIDFDNMSVGGSSTISIPSVWANGPCQWVPNGGFQLLDLTSSTDTVAYEMWKNTIGFFHLSGCTDGLIMPIAYQSIKGDVALDIVTHIPHINLHELITQLNNFGVVFNEDTLMKELYTIKQGSKEPTKCFDTWIGYAMMRLAMAFPHAMPAEQAKETRKTHFLSGLCPNLKSALHGRCAWMEVDIRWHMRKSRMLPDG